MTNLKKILLIFLILFLTSCGYERLNLIENKNKYEVKEYEFSGNKKINQILKNNLKIFKNKNNSEKINLKISSSEITKIATKNALGETNTYETEVTIEFFWGLKKFDEKSKKYNKKITYSSLNSLSELRQYQNSLVKDLTMQIVFEFDNYLLM